MTLCDTGRMQTQVASAAFASVIALAFSLALLDRWLRSNRSPSSIPTAGKTRSKHLLAWFVSMAAFVVASVALWAGAAFGWEVATFRVFYLFGAILSVPPLALGTLYLLGNEKTADRIAVAVAALSLFAVGVLAAAPTTGGLSVIGLPRGADVFSGLPRLLAAFASIAGTLVVIAGAIWTLQQNKKRQHARAQKAIQELERHEEQIQHEEQMRQGDQGDQEQQQETSRQQTAPRLDIPAPRQITPRIKAGVSLIALGTITLGLGGASNSVAEEMTAFALSLAVGAAFLFAGFLLATIPKTRHYP